MKRYRAGLLAFSLSAVVLGITACRESEPSAPADVHIHNQDVASFELLQTELFAKSCALSGCHVGSTPTGGLVLAGLTTHEQLINIDPVNTAAKADGLKRVKPGQPDNSFLLVKLKAITKPEYGARMPLGSHELSDSQIEFIRTWITQGAPKTGKVADPNLLTGEHGEFHPPDVPTSGFQIHLPPFSIPPNSEREIYFMKRSPNTSDVYVTKFEVAMRGHSHHFILYRNSNSDIPEGVVRDFDPTMADFLGLSFQLGSQEASFSYAFPEGVGLLLPARSQLDLNSHYVNPGSTAEDGEVYLNVHTQSQAPARLAQSFLYSDPNFSLPPNQVTTHTGYVPTQPDDVDLLMLTSHMHKHGTLFRIYKDGGVDNGKLLYENDRWDTPKVMTFNPPLRFNKGQRLRYEVTYNNTTPQTLKFGFTSEDEMCVVVGYYAPVK